MILVHRYPSLDSTAVTMPVNHDTIKARTWLDNEGRGQDGIREQDLVFIDESWAKTK